MALSLANIKRWWLMLSGKSIWHVNQGLGRNYSKDSIKGYYNDLTEKVTRIPELLDNDDLPILGLANGSAIVFPVAVFQYGLGAYDLSLESDDSRYIRKFMQCVQWTMANQDEYGRWNNFSHYSPEHPYGAMAQGEGASLLIRAWVHTRDAEYLAAAKKAIDYMLTSLDDGGTTCYDGDDVLFMEYTFKKMVMNGAIFSWWGLYDYVNATDDSGAYKDILDRSLHSLVKYVPAFACGYWSMYDLDGLIASPFYHNLHIAQMEAMSDLTGESIFSEYARKWKRQQSSVFCKSAAFVRKSLQKLLEH